MPYKNGKHKLSGQSGSFQIIDPPHPLNLRLKDAFLNPTPSVSRMII